MADDPENQKRWTAGYGHYQPSLPKTWNRIDDGRDAMHCVSTANDHGWGFGATGCDAMADDPENQKRWTAGYGHYQPSLSKTWNPIDDGRDAMHCVSTANVHRWGLGANCCVTTTPRASIISPQSKKNSPSLAFFRHIYGYICRVVNSPMFNLKPL